MVFFYWIEMLSLVTKVAKVDLYWKKKKKLKNPAIIQYVAHIQGLTKALEIPIKQHENKYFTIFLFSKMKYVLEPKVFNTHRHAKKGGQAPSKILTMSMVFRIYNSIKKKKRKVAPFPIVDGFSRSLLTQKKFYCV